MRPIIDLEVDVYQSRVGRLFVPKFYHDRASTNFLKHLIYLGEVKQENSKNELQYPNIGRKYYSYKKRQQIFHRISFNLQILIGHFQINISNLKVLQ